MGCSSWGRSSPDRRMVFSSSLVCFCLQKAALQVPVAWNDPICLKVVVAVAREGLCPGLVVWCGVVGGGPALSCPVRLL